MSEDIATTPKPASVFMSIEELMAISGFGPQQVRSLIRTGAFPGQVHQRSIIVPRQLWEAYLRGDWTPKPQPTPDERREAREARKAAKAAASSAGRKVVKQKTEAESLTFIRSHRAKPTG